MDGLRVAVQEYGVTNTELVDALTDCGAAVTLVPVYKWAMPEDTEPLRNAASATQLRRSAMMDLESRDHIQHCARQLMLGAMRH